MIKAFLDGSLEGLKGTLIVIVWLFVQLVIVGLIAIPIILMIIYQVNVLFFLIGILLDFIITTSICCGLYNLYFEFRKKAK